MAFSTEWYRIFFSFEYILGEFDGEFICSSSSKTIEGFLLLPCFLVQRLIFSTSRQSFGFADTSCLLGIQCQRSSNLEIRLLINLSSPRAESARAVTGRRCPHSGRGEDFLSRQPDFFTETAVTPERKVEKSFPRWEINRHVEG